MGTINLFHQRCKHFCILIAMYHLNFHRCVAQSYALMHHDLHLELQLKRSMLMFAMPKVRAFASWFAFGAATHTLNADVCHADRCFLSICQTHAISAITAQCIKQSCIWSWQRLLFQAVSLSLLFNMFMSEVVFRCRTSTGSANQFALHHTGESIDADFNQPLPVLSKSNRAALIVS